ncbi:DNA recombination protein RmuC [Imperialibacter roseus]|uniref:DNA recombination protein RmuC n=1 Tax=Imperialibacter roseus TaxID=1324217 RepID=A0ABZ0INA3_9BACT|nr:DNA recombination protein RmuC [Imperialibacter roseus]WOK06499.1 DNA recombination protein RmuC [Imperialibacter roseus]
MDLISLLIGLAIGLVATALVLLARQSTTKQSLQREFEAKSNEQNTQNALLKGKLEDVEKEAAGYVQEIKAEREKVIQLSTRNSTLEANYKNLQERLEEHKKEVAELQQRFTVEFKHLAQEIFEEKSKKFTDQNKTNIAEVLNPLREKIAEFEKKVEDTNKESLKWNSSLSEQIKNLRELNQQITKEAENLTRALKGDSKSQGSWGEMQLEAILEKAGLQKDIHYFKEKNFKNEDGSNQRPDYIIKLPDDKYLVLDSKVSLTAYTNFFNAENDLEQAKFLKLHIDSIYSHIKLLSERNYQNLYEISQPDYVMMFVANEPALTVAYKEDHALYEKGLDKNIVLVSTTTLLATLRTISYIWKQDMQNKNAEEIARQAGALYDKFDGFVADLVKVGNSLKQTKENYDAAMNKLVDGKDNLVRKTERLRELGAKTTRQLDQRLIDRSMD